LGRAAVLERVRLVRRSVGPPQLVVKGIELGAELHRVVEIEFAVETVTAIEHR
jgi:hypothetical protein